MTAVVSAATETDWDEWDELSIEALEADPKAGPNDAEERKQYLAYRILERYVYGVGDVAAGDKRDLKRLRTLVKEIQEPLASLPRAMIFYVDKKYEEAVNCVGIYVAEWADDGGNMRWDDLCNVVDSFSDGNPTFLTKLTETVDHIIPGSAAAYYIRAMASDGDVDTQASCLKQSLDKDDTYWFAAWWLGDIYRQEKNWQSAAVFFEKALQSESGKEQCDLRYFYAWSLSKLKRCEEEVQQLKEILRLDPNYTDVRNNLGVSLCKQGMNDEGLAVLDEALKIGEGGKQLFRNRAWALGRLRRFDDAIEAYKTPGGKLPVWVQTEIGKLQKLRMRQAEGLQIHDEEIEALSAPCEDDGSEAPISNNQRKGRNRRATGGDTTVHKESFLEELIDHRIRRGEEVFDRQLRMYESEEGLPGRQFIVAAGRMDLFAEDTKTGDLVIIELKKDEGRENVVEQIERYIACVQNEIAKERKVFGVICVATASSKLKNQVSSKPNLKLFKYDLTLAEVL